MKKWMKLLLWLVYVLAAGWLGFGMSGWQFVVGNVIGAGLLLVDKMVYVWWLYPFEQSSIQIQYWTRKKDIKAVLGLLVGNSLNQQKLLFKSIGFAAMWILLTIYVASSTGSIVAMGIVLGLGFDLVWALVKDWKHSSMLAGWFCWQIKRPVLEREVRWYAGVFIGVWSLFVLRLLLA